MRLSDMALRGSLVLASALASAQTIQISKENRTIAITTSDQATASADIAQVSVGFVTYGSESSSTYADGSRISNAVLQAMKDAGVREAQIASKSQSLQPLGEEDRVRFGKGLRFQLNQAWQVTVPAADAAKVLNIAVGAGANNSGDIQWSLHDENALEAAAAEKALTHARAIADRMAHGLNARLGALVYASNQTPPRGPLGMMFQSESVMGLRMAKVAPLAIVPDKVSKSATVYAVFSIE